MLFKGREKQIFLLKVLKEILTYGTEKTNFIGFHKMYHKEDLCHLNVLLYSLELFVS